MAERTCVIEDCEERHAARGWCQKHWRRWRKYGDAQAVPLASYWYDVPDGSKRCRKCLAVKPLDGFQRDDRYYQGVKSWCIVCVNAYKADWARTSDKARAYSERRNRDPRVQAINRRSHVRRKYGEGAEEIEARRLAGDPCDVCGNATERRVIDHAHGKGRARGLLCNNCNLTLGYCNDDPARLRALADYLDRHST